MLEKDIPDLNIFMMCKKVNENAFRDIPDGFYLRTCRKDELAIWKTFPFDNEADQQHYFDDMSEYFENVYLPWEEAFYQSCLFICDENDHPVATCFLWKAYQEVYTIHWLKVLKEYEGLGLGRAILTSVMKNLPDEYYPIYLHTQPGSFRAIKLYTDFGFEILTDEKIGHRDNHYQEVLKYLAYFMKDHYKRLKFTKSDGTLSEIARQSEINQF